MSQAHLTSLKERALLQYLLLNNDDESEKRGIGNTENSASLRINTSKTQQTRLFDLTTEYLVTETSVTLHDVFQATSKGNVSITAEMIQVAISLSVINQAILCHEYSSNNFRTKNLQTLTDSLLQKIVSTIIESNPRDGLEGGVWEMLGAFSTIDVAQRSAQDLLSVGVANVAQYFDIDIWRMRDSTIASISAESQDAMTLDDDFESQGSHQQGKADSVSTEISHEEIAAATGQMAFCACQAAKLCFISRPPLDADDETNEESAANFHEPTLPPGFIDYLIQLKPQEFLSCRRLLLEVFRSRYCIREGEACALLEYVGQNLLHPYEFERCEVALGVCLDVLAGLTEMWTSPDPGDVTDLGAQLYEWFIRKALDKGIASPHVQIGICAMLQRVIKIQPEYAKGLSLESARTSLFRVLQEGTLIVKYHVGNSISEIFGLFILKEHENILQDIVTRLPKTADYIEGIALRLFVFSRLGAAWSTLLRRCVYHILETPGSIPESNGHAKHCMAYLTRSLCLQNSQELFRLFASQIIYTWLKTQLLSTLPYDVFGYPSIIDLLSDVQDDVVGQTIMRGKDEEATQLAVDLGKSYNQLLEESFSKVAAYSISRDLSMPPSQRSQAPGAEARFRRLLGKEQYFSLITAHFPYVLTTFYKTVEDDEHVHKAFGKHTAFAKALNAYQNILAISSSDRVVPISQQPSFGSRYLIDQIEHLCRRSIFEIDSMWSSTLYVYVFRELLNGIHPALGSLHACSVIRRIRILICMAGSTATEGYPLEMALHALRPFLTDTQCSEDVVGIFQYLLANGESDLEEVPSFLVGIAVSTLTSTKAFLGSTQESTTQESQYKATMSKANAFHSWFATYLGKHTSPKLTGPIEKSFKAIVNAASNVTARGNARKGSYESDLLLEVFEDQQSGRNLLDQASRDLILDLLCSIFDPPPPFRDDIFGEDQVAARYAGVVWRTCQRAYRSHNYLLWAARVLGRAFAGTGNVDQAMSLEVQFVHVQPHALTPASEPSSISRSAILRALCQILLVNSRAEVSAVEKTLRSIANKAHGTEHFSDCEHVLAASLLKAMLWHQHHPVPELFKASTSKTLSDCAKYDEQKSLSSWIQELCIAIALTSDEDPILSELPRILTIAEGLAKQVFPYTLHLVLLNEAGGHENTKKLISEAMLTWFKQCREEVVPHVKVLLKTILYLRKQPLPNENAKADRSDWLDVDFKVAATAAAACSMFKTALLFLEIDHSKAAKMSRRSSDLQIPEPTELLLQIYQNIDEPDSFYGVQQPSSLSSLMNRFAYEQADFKTLSFQGAQFDSQVRLIKKASQEDHESMINILNTLDLHGLSQSLISKMTGSGTAAAEAMLNTARKLEQWDISIPTSQTSRASTIFKSLQGVNNAMDSAAATSAINSGFSDAMGILLADGDTVTAAHRTLGVLAILTEADEVCSTNTSSRLHEVWAIFNARAQWMRLERYAKWRRK